MPGISLPDRFNAADFFVDENIRAGRGGRVAFRFRGQSITYAEVAEAVARTAGALLELDLRDGERVLVVLPDSPELAAVFFGAIKAGIVPIPANTSLRAADYRYYLEDSGARAVIVHEELLPAVAPAWESGGLPGLEHILVVSSAASRYSCPSVASAIRQHCFRTLLERASPLREAAGTHRDDMAFWLYTSGSTGQPKGAVHLERDMVNCADLYAVPIQGLTSDDRIFSASKMFFAYGLGNSLYCPFRVGASSVLLPERPKAELCLEVIHQERPTLFFAVPTLYAALVQVPDAEKRFDTSSLRLAVSAGEPLPADLYRRFKERFGVDILDGLGSTEMLHIFMTNRPGDIRPGSSGKVVPGYEARIVDDEGRELPPGQVGNLWVKGESAAAFYWRKAELSRLTMRGEWLVTGDKYRQDEEGYFWYCGRADDMMKVSGQWVSPIEVESALFAHPAVLECAVVGLLDEQGLLRPKAFVVLRDGVAPSEALAEELKGTVRERLPPFKVPRLVEFVTELQKTATGKIQRYKLRAKQEP